MKRSRPLRSSRGGYRIGMMFAITIVLSIFLAGLRPATSSGAASDSTDPAAARIDSDLRSALETLGLLPSHFSLLSDYTPRDRYRLPWIEHLLEHPARMSEEVDRFCREIEEDARQDRPVSIGDRLAAPLQGRLDGPFPPDPAARLRHSTRIRMMGDRSGSSETRAGSIGSAYLYWEAEVRESFRLAFSALHPDTLRRLRSDAPQLLEGDDEDPDLDLFALERARKTRQIRTDRILELMGAIRRDAVLEAGRRGLEAAVSIRAQAMQGNRQGEEPRPSGRRRSLLGGWGRPEFPNSPQTQVEGEIVAHGSSPSGPWVIGGAGPNRYHGRFGLIVDLGGDDLYEETAADPEAVPGYRLVIDLSGDDRYFSREPGAQGGGLFEVSILIDESGNDLYESAGAVSQGAGFAGVGWLIDSEGTDFYRGDIFTQGAGLFGIGALWDRSGSDVYVCALQAQGNGQTAGVGLLLDEEGNDRYGTVARYTDVIRYQDHAITLCQGFGIGMRPDLSGGVGILLDLAGNDQYQCDIYGQGSSYWYSLGALVDRSGHDVYSGFQYVQGAGIHISLGLLLDQAGQDRYLAKGVSQGCGHDLGCGWLEDGSGEDVYVAYDLSQGAGSANGFGVLYDQDGNDQYVVQRESSTQGYGNPRRGSGSLGLLIDSRGQDAYLHGQSVAETTRVNSLRGVLFEGGGEATPEPAWPPDPPEAVVERAYSLQELFWMASSGEPKFRLYRERGLAELEKGGPAVLAFLRDQLGEKDARDRMTISNLFRELGAVSIPFLADSLRRGGRDAQILAARSLSSLGDPAAVELLEEALGAPLWPVRSYAAEGLGKSEGHRTWDLLVRTAREDPAPFVRKSAVVALARLDGARARPLLEELGTDGNLFVRLAALGRLEALDRAAAASD